MHQKPGRCFKISKKKIVILEVLHSSPKMGGIYFNLSGPVPTAALSSKLVVIVFVVRFPLSSS